MALKARHRGDMRSSLLGDSSWVICPKTRDFMKSLLQSCKSDILVEIHVARLPISMPLESFYSAENSGIKHFQTDSVFFQKNKDFPTNWKHWLLSRLSLTPPIWNHIKKIIGAADCSHSILKCEMIIMYIPRIKKANLLCSSPDPPFNMSHYLD